MSEKTVRIGCGSGFWGDTAEGPRQLVASGEIDYLVLDYLAEITMSLLARARSKKPEFGYATDFPMMIGALAPALKEQGIKVIANAGGVNPAACKAAVEAQLQQAGIELSVGIVEGDDLMGQLDALQSSREMFNGESFPNKPWSANAYLGAFPVAAALDAGADIVITGRCIDAAVALGPLIHEFGWQTDNYDQLAAGCLCGHVLECGAQATGGLTTDWELVADDWHNMGFPIAQCAEDGSFVLSKPKGTGGRIVPETTAEQVVYEIGDPGSYLLPDVTCDFRCVDLKSVGENEVKVSGARGRAPGQNYKASVTYQDGFRASGTMMIGGRQAVQRAEKVGEAIIKRCRMLFERYGMEDFDRVDIEVLGSESNWGTQSRSRGNREVILKVAAQHQDRRALELFGRECIPPATSMAQSITGFSGGRPQPSPLVRLFSCVVPKSLADIRVSVGESSQSFVVAEGTSKPEPESTLVIDDSCVSDGMIEVPLIKLAYGRSGDKGNAANIGVMARRAEFLPALRGQLTAETVKHYFAHFCEGKVERFEWPGLHGFNFLLQDALGGGGIASLRHDPQGKMLAQILMDFPIRIPQAWVKDGWVAA
ncbi:MAG: acyclic terpene utilization AtuA family protein [Oceanococcus sp.]